ncbi:MAG TPA: hypothetical protein VMH79_00025 [Thermoanaerobaculia bacterium]|nr:hypothetical protein [Thermoanaerobaculia bacterium]
MTGSRTLGLVVVLAVSVAAACRERGRPDPNVRMAISHERAVDVAAASQAAGVAGGPGGGSGADVPTRLEVPPEVQAAFGGIRLSWTQKSDGKTGVLEIPLGSGVPLPDPSLVVRADAYLPSFTMGGGAITSQGVEEQNPAARITVFEKGKEIFAGWIFARFPDVHPFVNPTYQLHLEGGLPKAGK